MTETEYGAFNLPVKITLAAGTVLLSYDQQGNLVGRTEPGLGEIVNTYDQRGRLLTESNPLGQTYTYSYDDAPHGLPVSITDPIGGVEARSYDDATR